MREAQRHAGGPQMQQPPFFGSLMEPALMQMAVPAGGNQVPRQEMNPANEVDQVPEEQINEDEVSSLL